MKKRQFYIKYKDGEIAYDIKDIFTYLNSLDKVVLRDNINFIEVNREFNIEIGGSFFKNPDRYVMSFIDDEKEETSIIELKTLVTRCNFINIGNKDLLQHFIEKIEEYFGL